MEMERPSEESHHVENSTETNDTIIRDTRAQAQEVLGIMKDFPLARWGRDTLEYWLSVIGRENNQALYSHDLLKIVESVLGISIQTHLSAGKFSKKSIDQISEGLSDEQLTKLAHYSKAQPTLVEKSFTMREFESLATTAPDIYQKRKALVHGKDLIATYKNIHFTLFTDGQELITLEKAGRKYVLRAFESSLPPGEIRSRFTRPIPGLPNTEIQVISSDTGPKNSIIAITEKIEGQPNHDVQRAIRLSQDLMETIGFEADIGHWNFMVNKQGAIFYVDSDLIEHLVKSRSLEANDIERRKLAEKIAPYISLAV